MKNNRGAKVSREAADKTLKLIEECASRIRDAAGPLPELALVLGSGFQPLAENIEVEGEISFERLPGFPRLGVQGHSGRLVWGRIGRVRLAVCLGRAHYYEGHSMESVTWPIRVLAACGARHLVLTNAAGGINPAYGVGDFMLFSDHINFIGVNPLRGLGGEDNGRFLDLGQTYSPRLGEMFLEAGRRAGVALHEGVYVGVSGPTYETPAEIRAFRALGADAVGMSTIPEAVMGRYCGMEVAALSCITNRAAGLGKGTLSHHEVLECARSVEGGVKALFNEFTDCYSHPRDSRP